MTQATLPGIPQATSAAARLNRIAGWSILVVAALHIAVFVPLAPWSEWFAGDLRLGDPDPESVSVFWALPGGIVLPAALFALLLIRLGRQRQRVGLGYGLALAAWVAFCVWLIGPSGFLALLVPAGLLIAAAVIDRPKTAPVAREASANASAD